MTTTQNNTASYILPNGKAVTLALGTAVTVACNADTMRDSAPGCWYVVGITTTEIELARIPGASWEISMCRGTTRLRLAA